MHTTTYRAAYTLTYAQVLFSSSCSRASQAAPHQKIFELSSTNLAISLLCECSPVQRLTSTLSSTREELVVSALFASTRSFFPLPLFFFFFFCPLSFMRFVIDILICMCPIQMILLPLFDFPHRGSAKKQSWQCSILMVHYCQDAWLPCESSLLISGHGESLLVAFCAPSTVCRWLCTPALILTMITINGLYSLYVICLDPRLCTSVLLVGNVWLPQERGQRGLPFRNRRRASCFAVSSLYEVLLCLPQPFFFNSILIAGHTSLLSFNFWTLLTSFWYQNGWE